MDVGHIDTGIGTGGPLVAGLPIPRAVDIDSPRVAPGAHTVAHCTQAVVSRCPTAVEYCSTGWLLAPLQVAAVLQ